MSQGPSMPRSTTWRILKVPSRVMCTLLFDLKVYGRQHIPARGGAILASNHQSYLDPVLLGVQSRRPLSYLAKSELFEHPAFSWLIRSLYAFPVRQGEGDVGALREVIRRARDGHIVTVYPEGSRSEDGQIAPLQNGIGLLVRKSGVPVIPAVIHGSFQAWPRDRRLFRPHPIRVMFGPPLRLEHLKAGQIVEAVDVTLRRMFAELRGME